MVQYLLYFCCYVSNVDPMNLYQSYAENSFVIKLKQIDGNKLIKEICKFST